jgi:hypothetical protein
MAKEYLFCLIEFSAKVVFHKTSDPNTERGNSLSFQFGLMTQRIYGMCPNKGAAHPVIFRVSRDLGWLGTPVGEVLVPEFAI